MRPLPGSYQGIKSLFFKVGYASRPGLGGALPGFLWVKGDAFASSLPGFQGSGMTETDIVGWSLFWLTAFVLGGIMGMLLYPLFHFKPPLQKSDLDPKREKFLIVGSGILTALILVTLYLLTQRTLSALAVAQGSAQFVIEMRNEAGQMAACSDQPLIAPSEIRGTPGKAVILKLTSAEAKPGFQPAPLSWQTGQAPCSQCHSVDLKAPPALTFIVNLSTPKTEAGLNTQGHLEVTY